MNDEYQSVGIGLYLAASVFDHSCTPNTAIIFNGKGICYIVILITKSGGRIFLPKHDIEN